MWKLAEMYFILFYSLFSPLALALGGSVSLYVCQTHAL